MFYSALKHFVAPQPLEHIVVNGCCCKYVVFFFIDWSLRSRADEIVNEYAKKTMTDDECSIFLPKRCLQQKYMDCPLKSRHYYSLLNRLYFFLNKFFSFAREEPAGFTSRSRFTLSLISWETWKRDRGKCRSFQPFVERFLPLKREIRGAAPF